MVGSYRSYGFSRRALNELENDIRSLTFPQVDLLRGFAAVSVVVYHVIEHFQWQTFPVSGALVWFRNGWMGVDLFFVISGFVISLAAFDMIDRAESGKFRFLFMKRRFARIAPLHYLTCLLFVALITPQFLLQSGMVTNLLSHIGFFHNFHWRWSGAINGPNWSVSVEMQFYLLVAVLAPFARNCRWWLIPLIAFSIAWAWRFGVFSLVPMDSTLGAFYRFRASTQLPGTLDQFAVGALLARFLRSASGQQRMVFYRRIALVPMVVAAIAIWAMLMLYWPRASFWDHLTMVVFWRTFAAVSFGLVIFAACCADHPWLLVITRPLRYLGTISYGIYLWHLSVILAVKRIEGIPAEKALGLVLILTFVLAATSWHFFEKRFLMPRKAAAQ